MKKFDSTKIKNIAVAGHAGSGKTSLTEALLYKSGTVDRLGKVLEGTTVSDYTADEIKRKCSVYTSLSVMETSDLKVNLLDTPGLFDYESGMVEGIFAGGWGLFLSTESLAKMGLLYARDGVWKGRRILPEGWAAQVGAPQILQDPAGRNPENDWAAGYGYHFWTCRHGFRMDGAHGQLVIILPEKDAVIVLTGFTDAPTEMNAVWQYIYPTL